MILGFVSGLDTTNQCLHMCSGVSADKLETLIIFICK